MNKRQLFVTVLLIAILALATAASFFYLFNKFNALESKVNSLSPEPNITESVLLTDIPTSVENDGCGPACQKIVNDIVSDAISTMSSKTKVVTEKVTTTKTAATAYVPMGTTYTTTSTDWYSVNDTAVYIDLINEYGKNATVSFEASLKVAHGNGQAYVRLWDDTNKIAVNGSELTTINNVSYTLVSTGNLPFWNGRNLYKLQIKSLNSFEVSVTGGKIKIQY